MEYKMCRLAGGGCHECVDTKMCKRPLSYTPGFTETFKEGRVFQMNTPTCPLFEPKFLKVARIATRIVGNDIFDDMGNNIARIYSSVVLNPSDWFRSANQELQVPVVVKNPEALKELEDSIGIRNGLTAIWGIPLAVSVSDSGIFRVSRPTQPYKSENIFCAYHSLLERAKNQSPVSIPQ